VDRDRRKGIGHEGSTHAECGWLRGEANAVAYRDRPSEERINRPTCATLQVGRSASGGPSRWLCDGCWSLFDNRTSGSFGRFFRDFTVGRRECGVNSVRRTRLPVLRAILLPSCLGEVPCAAVAQWIQSTWLRPRGSRVQVTPAVPFDGPVAQLVEHQQTPLPFSSA
jgi:hypothetical protein